MARASRRREGRHLGDRPQDLRCNRIARAEDAAEVEYNEQRKIEAAEMLSERVAPDVSVQTPICHPVQVPTWLPASRSSLAKSLPPGVAGAFALGGRDGGDVTAQCCAVEISRGILGCGPIKDVLRSASHRM